MEKRVSVIIPAYNEEKNILITYNKVKKCLSGLDFEIVFIDDGSTDKTKKELKKIKDKKVKVIFLNKRMGKSYALFVGIKKSKNNIIATIDADLQDDPLDILKLLKKIDKGYDLVCGWRHKRKDNFRKKISSKIGNFINNKILKINLHDNNCSIKVFRKKCFSNLKYFKDMHRFLPVLAKIQGFKISEEKVKNYPRAHGKSKYGIHNRIFGNLKVVFLIKFKKINYLKNNDTN